MVHVLVLGGQVLVLGGQVFVLVLVLGGHILVLILGGQVLFNIPAKRPNVGLPISNIKRPNIGEFVLRWQNI